MMKSIYLVIAVALLSACSTTSSYKFPTARSMSPENSGESHGTFLAGYHQSQEVTVTTDIANTRVSASQHDRQTFENWGALFSYGVLDALDLGVTADFWMPSIVFAKWQLLGDPKSKADAGNFSFSALGGVGVESSKTEYNYDLFTTSSERITRESSTIYMMGGLLGYRPSKTLLLLAGATYSTRSLDGKQVLNGSTTEVPFHDQPKYYEFHGGLQFSFGNPGETQFLIQPMIYRGFLQSFGSTSTTTTFSFDIGCNF